MNQRLKILRRAFITHHQATEVLQPRIGSLDHPAPTVPSQLSPVLMRRHPVILALRDDRLDLPLDQQRPRRIAVIAPVGNQSLRLVRSPATSSAPLHFDRVERAFEEFDLRRGSRLHAYSERSTLAICQYHKLCPLAAFGLAHTVAPFLAVTNMPSTKHSFQRIFLASLSWSRKARHRFKSRPLSAHWQRRLWTALLEPYRSGSSLQGAPVHKIQRMPSKHWRSVKGGRPPRGLGGRLGSCVSMSFHWLSVTARQVIRHLRDLVSYRNPITCQPVSG